MTRNGKAFTYCSVLGLIIFIFKVLTHINVLVARISVQAPGYEIDFFSFSKTFVFAAAEVKI